ncbi:MAG: amidohydrolase [Firmicutes bacterium]|nr:amidohydrolase [Bacillota bacterium]
MIIDTHGHVVAPAEVYSYQAQLVASRNNPDLGAPHIDDALLEQSVASHLETLRKVGTDIQFISPRPYHMMHSLQPYTVVQAWTRFVNDIIAQEVRLHPDVYRGVAALPESPTVAPSEWVSELERCVREYHFVGCLLNPDPTEAQGTPPGLGERYWYPVYEKLVELNVPALIHSASSASPRESYTLHFINEESIAILSLLESDVFRDFPDLKIVVAHSGGAIPYQMGRFRAWAYRRHLPETFDESLRHLYFDTCNYSKDSLELLIKTVGADRVLFGTENPGTGTVIDPATGRTFDDVKPMIDSIEWLSAADRQLIYEDNARKVYSRAFNK